MQISPAPPLPQNSAAATQPHTVGLNQHQLAAQSAAPITQQAIVPTEKTEKPSPVRAKDKNDPSDRDTRKKSSKEQKRGESVNISV